MPLSVRHIAALGFGIVCASGAASAEQGALRLHFEPQAQTDADPGTAPTLEEMLSMTPRVSGLQLNLDTPAAQDDQGSRVRLDYGDRTSGVGYQVFGSVGDAPGGRFGISGLQPRRLDLGAPESAPLSLAGPAEAQNGQWRVGGRIDYAGFTFGADMAREWKLDQGASVRDYRLGMSYGGDEWRVGMQYMRSLSGNQERLTAVSDAVELGGAWNVAGSVNLVGGVQLWDQTDPTALDADSQRAALIFLGTRIQF